ncbi:MAG TPA: hypothetical protein PKJ14_02730 [Candidatus Cloacimonadota bacterium]|nr:hypothetical protein [Candidatus Cloacimonadota bacterium]HQL15098.1 hypothetical protein [Candidatus Cloacimonadota bacterium]
MKTVFRHNQAGLTGRMDDLILYYRRDLEQILAKKYTKPAHNPNADRLKAVMANLKTLQPSAGYIQNFKDYLIRYNNLPASKNKHMVTWNNLWLKVIYAMAKSIPGLDLMTLSREQIYSENLPCKTLCSAIEAGLLPKVMDFQRYNNPI